MDADLKIMPRQWYALDKPKISRGFIQMDLMDVVHVSGDKSQLMRQHIQANILLCWFALSWVVHDPCR